MRRAPRFNADLLRPFLKRLVSNPEVTNAVWDRDAEKLVKRAEEMSAEVKRRMVGAFLTRSLVIVSGDEDAD